jgi:hypothetical protein
VSTPRKWLTLVLVLGLAVASSALIILRVYALELVHAVVVNKVIQRLPDDYPAESVRRAFQARLAFADSSSARAHYLEELKALSIQLEKVQGLDRPEVDRILSGISEDRLVDEPE